MFYDSKGEAKCGLMNAFQIPMIFNIFFINFVSGKRSCGLCIFLLETVNFSRTTFKQQDVPKNFCKDCKTHYNTRIQKQSSCNGIGKAYKLTKKTASKQTGHNLW